MQVIDLPLAQLQEAPWNPNRLSPDMRVRLRRSLARFGLVSNLVVRPLAEGLYEVLSGNQRLSLLRELSFVSVPCVVLDLDETQAKLLAQALNRLLGQDEPGLKVALLRDLLARLPQEEVLALLPESAQSLSALGSLPQQDLAGMLRGWDQAQQVRLRHLTFQLAHSQLQVIDAALAQALARSAASNPDNPNPRGNALFWVCQTYLNIDSEGANSHD
jgi:ParB family chromosome partitioning protein